MNKARENASFNKTLSGTIQNAMITPKPIARKGKLVLKRHKSNFSLGRPSNQLPPAGSSLQETVSQTSSYGSMGATLNPSQNKHEVMTGKFYYLNLVNNSARNSPLRISKKTPFSYPLPPKRPSVVLPKPSKTKSSFISSKSSSKGKADAVQMKALSTKGRKISFVDIFNAR